MLLAFSSKNFLLVELHGNDMPGIRWSLEAMCALSISAIFAEHSFREIHVYFARVDLTSQRTLTEVGGGGGGGGGGLQRVKLSPYAGTWAVKRGRAYF